MSSELRELQRDFQAYLLESGGQMRGRVVDGGRLGADERLDIYADAYRLRLTEALMVDFPALHTLLGDAVFFKMVAAYIDAHPSRHFSIRWFGRYLSDFLADYDPNQPVLEEMAAFEWALSGALDASDAPVLGVGALASISPEQWPELQLKFHPSVSRLDLSWNVPALWKAINGDEPPRPPEKADPPQAWLIWRQDLASFFKSLSPAEAGALDAAQAGQSFAGICESLVESVARDQVALHAATFLRGWLQEGLISAVDGP